MHSAKEKKKEEGCDDGELRLHRVNAVVRDENFVCVKELLASFTMQCVRGDYAGVCAFSVQCLFSLDFADDGFNIKVFVDDAIDGGEEREFLDHVASRQEFIDFLGGQGTL